MTEEFLTKGLQNDRYVKAILLINQFEDEIEAVLRDFDKRMVDEQPNLFDPDANLKVGTKRHPSDGIAFHRINHPMNGPQAPDGNQQLNVHLYWMPPAEYDRIDIDGALRGFGYKIKHADTDTDDEVAKRTKENDWPIETSGNPYDSNTVFYSHVSSAKEINETAETLIDHFSEFGYRYTADSDGDS